LRRLSIFEDKLETKKILGAFPVL